MDDKPDAQVLPFRRVQSDPPPSYEQLQAIATQGAAALLQIGRILGVEDSWQQPGDLVVHVQHLKTEHDVLDTLDLRSRGVEPMWFEQKIGEVAGDLGVVLGPGNPDAEDIDKVRAAIARIGADATEIGTHLDLGVHTLPDLMGSIRQTLLGSALPMSAKAQLAAARETHRMLKAAEAAERDAIADLEVTLPDARRWRELVRLFSDKKIKISEPADVDGVFEVFATEASTFEALLWEVSRALIPERDRTTWKPEDALVDVLEANPPLPLPGHGAASSCTLDACALCGTDPDYPPLEPSHDRAKRKLHPFDPTHDHLIACEACQTTHRALMAKHLGVCESAPEPASSRPAWAPVRVIRDAIETHLAACSPEERQEIVDLLQRSVVP